MLICLGTEFMAKLHEQLKYFVAKKVSTDHMWQGLRIYLSGHEVCGEKDFGLNLALMRIEREVQQKDFLKLSENLPKAF